MPLAMMMICRTFISRRKEDPGTGPPQARDPRQRAFHDVPSLREHTWALVRGRGKAFSILGWNDHITLCAGSGLKEVHQVPV